MLWIIECKFKVLISYTAQNEMENLYIEYERMENVNAMQCAMCVYVLC